jgi:hypothetical protein
MTKEQIAFEVWDWSEWEEDINKRLKGELKHDLNDDPIAEITVMDLLYAPALNTQNPQPFCKAFNLTKCYEDRIFVRHIHDKDSFWFINGEDTCLVYRPKVKIIKTEV